MSKREFKRGDRVAGDWYNPEEEKFIRVQGYFGDLFNGAREVHEAPAFGSDAWLCAPNSIHLLKKKERREYYGKWVMCDCSNSVVFVPYIQSAEGRKELEKLLGSIGTLVEARKK